ncbi:MAG: DNA polymerase I [Deltaproteobacteria bacterium]|nr:DNA polymerase I [Deltaproteobacteria bacterium]
MTAKKLFLLDASSYIFRAFYATPSLKNAKGFPTNAIYGFVQMLSSLMRQHEIDHLVSVYDRPEPTFRKQAYQEYKAQRAETPEDLSRQIPLLKEIVQEMGVPALEKIGFEADDLIGTLAYQARDLGYEVVIVTGDKDLMQLVQPGIRLLDTMKNKWCDEAEVKEKFGVKPSQVIEVLGLAGDSSDNIPGVPGVGEKTAMALMEQFGNLEGLYENIEQLKGKRKEILIANKELAFLSRQLATIDTKVSFEWKEDDFKLRAPDQEKLNAIYQDLGFQRLIKKIETESETNAVSERPEKLSSHYQLIQSLEALDALIQKMKQASWLAVDTETTSLNTWEARLVGISLSFKEGEAYYLPVGHSFPTTAAVPIWGEKNETPPLHLMPGQLPLKEALRRLKGVLENPKILKIAQNFKYDDQVLRKYGIEIQGFAFDTLLASYLVEPAAAHNLDRLSQHYLGHKMISFKEVTENKKNPSFAEVSLEKALAYSAEDADVAFRLKKILEEELKTQELEEVFHQIEIPLLPILSGMELLGIKIDREFLSQLQKDFSQKLELSQKKIYALAGREININSPKQLGQLLFEELKLPVQRKTKTGFSTDVEVLTELAKYHEVPKEILFYRSITKLKSTYVDALLNLARPGTDRVHTSFNQTIAETGRLSSSDPNLQNIPIKTEEGKKIRQAFIAEKGFELLSADYSQVELRILAHLCSDAALIQAFEKDEDIHRLTAASIFGVAPGEVTSLMRGVGKTVNFGIVYGQTPFGLSQQLGIPPQKAKEYIENYFEKFPGVQSYRQSLLQEAYEKGKVRTLYGRQRILPDLHSKNPNLRNMAERMAFNAVIQGTAADIIKLAMIRFEEIKKKEKLESRLLLQVHDELVFEVKEEEKDTMKKWVQEAMSKVAQFQVPLKVEMGLGKNWGEAH